MRFALAALFAALIVTLLAVPTHAANCRYVQTYAQQYYVPQYHVQQYAVVADYNTVIIPKAFQVQVASPFYLGVADSYREADLAERVAIAYARIVEAQKQHLASGATGPAPLTSKPTTKIGQILSNRCVSCHTYGKQEPDLSGDPDLIPEIVRLKAFGAAARNEMPKGKPPLPNDEFNELGAWSKLKPTAIVPTPIPPAAKEPGLKAAPMDAKK